MYIHISIYTYAYIYLCTHTPTHRYIYIDTYSSNINSFHFLLSNSQQVKLSYALSVTGSSPSIADHCGEGLSWYFVWKTFSSFPPWMMICGTCSHHTNLVNSPIISILTGCIVLSISGSQVYITFRASECTAWHQHLTLHISFRQHIVCHCYISSLGHITPLGTHACMSCC